MIRYTHLFGRSIPVDMDRVTKQVRTAKLRLFFFLFAFISALFHPSAQLAQASIPIQVSFWIVGYLVYFYSYRMIIISAVRLATARGWQRLYASVPIELTNLLAAVVMFGFAKLVGIPTDDVADLGRFLLFNVVLYELGSFCYIAYADRSVYPEIYQKSAGPRNDHDIFLSGSTFLAHHVDIIAAKVNGVEVSSRGQMVFVARPFGQVIGDLPMDLGFQIHRSLWVSRELALRVQTEGRKQFIQLPDGRRFPIARHRQRAYRAWLEMVKGVR